MDDLIKELDETLSLLEKSPDNVGLIRKQARVLKELSMDAEYLDTVLRLSTLVMLDEGTWLDYFSRAIPSELHLDSFVEILERFEQAERDYLSVQILLQHIQFILAAASTSDTELASILTVDYVREMLHSVTDRGKTLLGESHKLWQLWLDWEMVHGQVENTHSLFLERLEQPHLELDATMSTYSSFCTTHSPNDYEARLVQATKASQSAKAKLSEVRYGQTRADFEQQLAYADPAGQPQIYLAYIKWETVYVKRDKGPQEDRQLKQSVYERAILAYARLGDAAYKTAEAVLWLQYAGWADDPVVLQRASRACPQSGTIWSRLMLLNELVLDTSIALGMLDASGLAEVFVAQAASEARQGQNVIETVSRGLEAVHQGKSGDPNFRLEKFVLEWAEVRMPDQLEAALALATRSSASRSKSYQMALLISGVQARNGSVDAARQTLTKAMHQHDLDWPEAIFEALLQLEQVHGDVDTFLATIKAVDTEQLKLARRRERQQEVYYEAAEPVTAEVVEAPKVPEAPVENQGARNREHTSILVSGLPKGLGQSRVESLFESCGRTREVTVISGDTSDTALVEFRDVSAVPEALKRDRRQVDDQQIHVSMLWRSTLYVTNFPPATDDESIRIMFSNYGVVLQTRWPAKKYAESRRFCYITMSSPADAENALVLHGYKNRPEAEFGMTVLISDPAAKVKRSDDSKSTLFIGGLRSTTTETDVREIFAKFGTIANVKLGWDPVKSVCRGTAYLTMSTPAEAEACIQMHGTKYFGRKLNVEIYDRNHANKKTAPITVVVDRRERLVRLEGLPTDTQEGLLQQALEKVVPVKKLEVFGKDNHAIAELQSAADVGTLLLHKEPFIFNGKTITITDARRTAPIMAPRQAAKPSIKKGRVAPPDKALAGIIPTAAASQTDFRAIVAAKNNQRKGNLEALVKPETLKRSTEEEPQQEAKKHKTE